MAIENFVKKYLGKKVDWDNAYGGQCVDLFRQYVNDVLELKQPKGVKGAKDFWANYETDPVLKENFVKIPNTPTAIPQEGDAMIWDSWKENEFGHIAIFLRGDINKFTSLDQNFPTLNKVTETEHNYKTPKVLGWLRPKKFVQVNPCDEIQKKYELLRAKWDKRDREYDELKVQLEQYTQANEDLRKRNKELTDANTDLTALNEALLEETKLLNALKNAVVNLFRR